jgi:hypothetical protein
MQLTAARAIMTAMAADACRVAGDCEQAMNELKHFAECARGFRRWIEESQSEGGPLAREALLQLVGLYHAGLTLPSPFLSAAGDEHSIELGNAEVDGVRVWCGRLPFNLYSEVFDPTVVPSDEPVIGDIGDDCLTSTCRRQRSVQS